MWTTCTAKADRATLAPTWGGKCPTFTAQHSACTGRTARSVKMSSDCILSHRACPGRSRVHCLCGARAALTASGLCVRLCCAGSDRLVARVQAVWAAADWAGGSRTSVEQSRCSHRQHGEGPPASTGARGKLMTGGRWVREVRGSTRQRQECQSGEGGVHKLRRCVGRGWPAGVVGSAGRRVGAATLTTGLS